MQDWKKVRIVLARVFDYGIKRKAKDQFNIDAERPLIGIVKYSDGTVKEGDLVGFRPSSEYEFVVDGERLYRVLSNFITIKYEYQGDEEEYNPSWAKSS